MDYFPVTDPQICRMISIITRRLGRRRRHFENRRSVGWKYIYIINSYELVAPRTVSFCVSAGPTDPALARHFCGHRHVVLELISFDASQPSTALTRRIMRRVF